jgi:serine/threonine protein kinase
MFKKVTGKKEHRHESVHTPVIILSERDQTLTRYEQEFQKLQSESCFLSEHPAKFIPKFGQHEIEAGPILGVGGFCAVREVRGIALDPSLSHLQPECQASDGEFHETETREYMSNYCMRVKSARYAIKMMKKEFENEKLKYRGMLDLAIEAEYLSRLAHPNIIKMRGSLDCKSTVREEGFYIVLDRLYETLQQKIDIIWPKEYKVGPLGFIGKDKGKMRRIFLERMIVAHDLSSVFRYLHSKRYVLFGAYFMHILLSFTF